MSKAKVVHINAEDNVVVAIAPISKGMEIQVDDIDITAVEDIPQGHKVAVKPIKKDEQVIKYGVSIGHATKDIEAGQWVHTHDMATNLSGEVVYTYNPAVPEKKEMPVETFEGFVRPDGKVGTRNEIWIIPTVGCVNDVAKHLVEMNQDIVKGSIEGLYTYTHPFGCSQTGGDHAQTRKVLADLVRHPNAGAVLVLSLGCENLTHEQFLTELGEYDPERVKFLTCQEVEDELEVGSKLLHELSNYAGKFKRETVGIDKLVLGMKCGGSDGLSGITANPTVGRVSDMIVAQGGTTILTEVPEMFGAESMLMDRCINNEVFEKASNMLNGFKDYFISHNEVVYDNPSPGNKEGGITTLEDKSCGCVQKGGKAAISDVLSYAEPVHTKGLNLLYGPGNDLVSSTNLTAAGCTVILFTTGRGTPFGAPAPVAKIATNDRLAEKKKNWIDFNAGPVASSGESVDDAGRRLFDFVKEIASGKQTQAEKHGFREISIFKDGVVL
ncbi:UxaA family hydrolase [Oribacterium sp. FC2011]|uniref:UxaA family hydrolase n=1 Tax=Oribacterium sp. FC2011 TaxID=1408311 RepID=UPI0004E0BE5F|nr:altronate dehydratase family protein [Oribacterium sp. FC2011]